MPNYLAFGLVAIPLFVAFVGWHRSDRYRRAEFIRSYRLPLGLYDKVRQHRPELSYRDCALVSHGLRQFFLAYLSSRAASRVDAVSGRGRPVATDTRTNSAASERRRAPARLREIEKSNPLRAERLPVDPYRLVFL